MTNIVVTGLPENSKIPKLIHSFRQILKRVNVKRFWIKDISDIRGTDLKEATFELYDPDCAFAVLDLLDGFNYTIGQQTYPLSACVSEFGERPPSPYRSHQQGYDRYERQDRHQQRNSWGRGRSRSRSPVMNYESSKLDLEIELLKKQRMIIEEERKLLLERKKLELIKEFGPSAMREFEELDSRERRRRSDAERDEFRPRRRSPPRPREKFPKRTGPGRLTYEEKSALHTKTPPKKIKAPKERLPNFYKPCNMILGQMREVIQEHADKPQSMELYKILRTDLRKRFTICVASGSQERQWKTAGEIVKLYRRAHPPETDVQLVKKLLETIKACKITKKRKRNDVVANDNGDADANEVKLNDDDIVMEEENVYEADENIDTGLPSNDDCEIINEEDGVEFLPDDNIEKEGVEFAPNDNIEAIEVIPDDNNEA